jgi:hypothetical protein
MVYCVIVMLGTIKGQAAHVIIDAGASAVKETSADTPAVLSV